MKSILITGIVILEVFILSELTDLFMSLINASDDIMNLVGLILLLVYPLSILLTYKLIKLTLKQKPNETN